MGRRTDDSDPRRHTAIVGDVPMMWQKLAWDVDQFDGIQRDFPDIPEPLAFAAINVCISAASLRDWAVAAYVKRRREEGHKETKADVIARIHADLPYQRMCEAIADTAKHSRFAERDWVGGQVRMDWSDGGEDDPPGYILRHVHAGGGYESIALNAFSSLEAAWWNELEALGFALPQHRNDFEWRQRRIRLAFGFAERGEIELAEARMARSDPDGSTKRPE